MSGTRQSRVTKRKSGDLDQEETVPDQLEIPRPKGLKPGGNFRSLQKKPQFRFKSSFATEKLKGKVQAKLKTNSLLEQYGSLISPTDTYKILEFIGQGNFGKVVKCLKESTDETVAIKILNADKFNPENYENECNILRRLNMENADKFHIVRALDFFTWRDQPVLAFEVLAGNLEEYLQNLKGTPVPLNATRSVAKQMLTALSKLKELRIIHADIKPENIMFLENGQQSYQIKLIDFGLAVQLPTNDFPEWRQSRFYRAPEVILGLPHSEAIDMWSVGCILGFMLLGSPLYPGYSVYDQIRYICETQGVPPEHMLHENEKALHYFCQERGENTSNGNMRSKWRLKTPKEYKRQTGTEARETRIYILESLDEIIKVNSRANLKDSRKVSEGMKKKRGVELLKRMLALDGEERISPEGGLDHSFLRPFNALENSPLFNG